MSAGGAGAALVFQQGMLHEGEPVGAVGAAAAGEARRKYLLRADVVYTRVGDGCEWAAADHAAYELLLQAEQADQAEIAEQAARVSGDGGNGESLAATGDAVAARLRERAFAASGRVSSLFGGEVDKARQAAAVWRAR